MLYLTLLAGFAALIIGAEVFVRACVYIAALMRVPPLIIGLTIVAVGTSMPETVININAATRGVTDIAVGNILGSNMVNLMLIVGICALVKPMIIKFSEIRRDYLTGLGFTVILLILMLAFPVAIPRWGAGVLFFSYLIYATFIIRAAANSPKSESKEKEDSKMSLPKAALFFVAGLAAIIIGGDITVDSAVRIAAGLGISDRIIGLTVIAIGTSLPEFVICLIACFRGGNDIAMGNIIGSSAVNIAFILGLTGLISPLAVNSGLVLDNIILLAFTLFAIIFFYRGKIGRPAGALMAALYLGYMGYAIFN